MYRAWYISTKTPRRTYQPYRRGDIGHARTVSEQCEHSHAYTRRVVARPSWPGPPTERRYFATAVGKDDSMAAQTSAGALFASTRLTAPDGS